MAPRRPMTRGSHRRRAAIAIAVACGMAAAASGCAVVKPHQRERLAAPAMESVFEDDRAGGEHKDKIVQSKTGGGLPGGAPGGGCGCTQ
jgi:uncharacterized protein DUF4266